LEEMSQEFGTETCWIRLVGREKGVRIREKDGCDKEYQIADTEIRQTISETIDECLYKNFGSFFQKEHSIAPSPLLVGFSIVFDLCIILFSPKFLQHVNSCLNFQKLAKEAMRHEQQNVPTPCLRETLPACRLATYARDSQELATQFVDDKSED
jgi:hypothetical protein